MRVEEARIARKARDALHEKASPVEFHVPRAACVHCNHGAAAARAIARVYARLSADHFCTLDEQVVDDTVAVRVQLLQREVLVIVWREDGAITAEHARALHEDLAQDVRILLQRGRACVDLALGQAAIALLVNEVRLDPAARQSLGNNGTAQVCKQLPTKQTALLRVVVEGVHVEDPGVLHKVLACPARLVVGFALPLPARASSEEHQQHAEARPTAGSHANHAKKSVVIPGVALPPTGHLRPMQNADDLALPSTRAGSIGPAFSCAATLGGAHKLLKVQVCLLTCMDLHGTDCKGGYCR